MVREVLKVVVHCSDSPDDRDIGLTEIDSWHKERFTGVNIEGQQIYCGYHYIIRRDGTVEVGRPEFYAGAHVNGHNRDSIGICWIGRKEITPEQTGMLINLIRNICLRYALTSSNVFGHTELNPSKTCPNINMAWVRRQIDEVMGR